MGSQKSTQKSTQKTGDNSQKILELMMTDAYITTETIAQELGISRRAVAKHTAKLKEKGILRRVGPDKGGHWEVVEKK